MARQANCDKLWKIWYAIIVLGFHVYLVYNAISRYSTFRVTALRAGDLWDHGPMNFYLGMIIISMSLLPIFVYTTLMKTGNYANDSVQIGRDTDNIKIALDDSGKMPPSCCLDRLRKHFLPFSSALHLISAYCLLLPIPVLEAQKIKYKKSASHLIWHTDLDFIFKPDDYKTDKSYYNEDDVSDHVSSTPSPEFVNYVLALTVLLLRYPGTFWYTSRSYSLIFSILTFLGNLHLLFNYCGMASLYKINYVVYTSAEANRPQPLKNLSLNIPSPAVLVLASVGTFLVLVANMALFEYGYMQFLDNVKKYRNYLTVENGGSERSGSSTDSQALCFSNYVPQVTGIALMIFIVCFKVPVIWDYVNVYRSSNDALMLTCLVLAVIYLTMWVMAWFLFSLKANWVFNIFIPLQPMSDLGHHVKHPCFHDNPAMVHSPANGRVPSVDCCSDSNSSKTSSRHNNYVYVHSALPNIPTISESVDVVSESSYDSHNSGQQHLVVPVGPGQVSANGVLKYAVRRSSTSGSLRGSANNLNQMIVQTGSLQRNSKLRKSANRVTFKEEHEMIPGSPISEQSSQNTSSGSGSDSGIESTRPTVDGNSDYAQVRKTAPRPPTRTTNYDDYAMFGNLFEQHHYYNQSDFATYTDMYGRGNYAPIPPPPLPPPPPPQSIEPEYLHVPDILMSETPPHGSSGSLSRRSDQEFPPQPLKSHSPYGSLQRPKVAPKPVSVAPPLPLPPSDFMELQNQNSALRLSREELHQLQEDIDERLCSQV